MDREGKGEALYQLHADNKVFHFFVLSRKLDDREQVDRNFASKWDVTAALCEGGWNSERETHLRREIPKQTAGWCDTETLVLTRGNRSGRLFEHVVESLASGQQPDAKLLGKVGYILRTTGFIGNGAVGTKPHSALEPDHPLAGAYVLQMCAAYMCREFVFDLVDGIAAERSRTAVPLAPKYRRYLGLGNSAATGLVRFIYNHPRLIHQWCNVWELAFAEAKAREIKAGSTELQELKRLLSKASGYFCEDANREDQYFYPSILLANDLRKKEREIFRRTDPALAQDSWRIGDLLFGCRRDRQNVAVEEVLNSLIIELFPDIIQKYEKCFEADEQLDLVPWESVGELRGLVEERYSWLLQGGCQSDDKFFWFHSVRAPEDARRGYRGIDPEVEHESNLDMPHRIRELAEVLRALPDEMAICDLVAEKPNFRHVISWVQTLRNSCYSELRDNPLAEHFSPYGPIRLVLAFFGMEKFDSAPPKLVRGALLQGFPTPSDVAAGVEGTVLFPLLPKIRDR